MMKRALILTSLLTVTACGDATGPPPPDLLAAGEWIGDWQLLDGEFFRINPIIIDTDGALSGSCRFEVQGVNVFLSCASLSGTRTSDHQSGSVSLSFDFSGAGCCIGFNGSLSASNMVGTLADGTNSFAGYTYRRAPTSASLNPRPGRTEAVVGTRKHERLTRVLRMALSGG